MSLDFGLLHKNSELMPNVYQSLSIQNIRLASGALDSFARDRESKDREQTQEILCRNKKPTAVNWNTFGNHHR